MASSVSTASTVGAWHGRVTIGAPGAAARTRSVTLEHSVVGEVLEQPRGGRRELQPCPAAARDRSNDVLHRRRIDRQSEPTEGVQILQTDAVDLGVATEVGKQGQRLDRPGVLGAELP